MIADSAPDYFVPVVGWRVWLVVRCRGALRLRSVAFPTIWQPRAELRASCEARRSLSTTLRRRKRHETPRPECDCGIHGAKEIALACGYLSAYDDFLAPVLVHRVIGSVSLWGDVVECDRGWRASHAYPSRLYVPPRGRRGRVVDAEGIADSLAEYGVPAAILDEHEHPDVVAALAKAGEWRDASDARPTLRRRLFGS